MSDSSDPSLRDVRAVVKDVIGTSSIAVAADVSCCAPNTIWRVLRCEDVRVTTLARILRAHGYQLRIGAERMPPQ